ncbi:MAG: gliding motility lipoprotein GldH [Bacteroidia bacterium]|nr:gliding motility lipoprotein GldH [Bacteroidia bacterium]
MPSRFRTVLLICIVSLILSSCRRGMLYQKYTELPAGGWDYKAPVRFSANINDTTNFYNIFVNIRNSDSYEYSNLYLFIDITTPMHTHTRDTLECILAAPSGRWLGKGLGDIWDNKILYKQGVRFPKRGEYNFTFTQAMRDDKLQMIMDMGLTIEKSPATTQRSD